MQRFRGEFFRRPDFPEMFEPVPVDEIRKRLIITLVLINAGILVTSGGAGYFLAGRTLRPIKDMVDEQNRFITDASHELRTPLTSLRSEIEVGLRNTSLTLTESKKLLESNLEEVVSLQTLSDNLLELAQFRKPADINAGKDVSLIVSIDAAVKKLNGIFSKKRITIEKKVDELSVRGIPDRITELFVILLDNAVKYSPEKSKITITAKQQDKIVRIEVKDQGMGIAEEDLPHIFDRFYRASKSRSKVKIPGYGLGLSIAKKIIDLHHGSIQVKSAVGKGTTLTIHLPLSVFSG